MALLEELVVGVDYGKKKEKLFIVRKNKRLEKKREKLVVAPLDMRWSIGGYASDLWWRQASGDDGLAKKLGGRLFFLIFAPDFLHPQAMKSTPIYKGWKRDVLSLLVPNLDF